MRVVVWLPALVLLVFPAMVSAGRRREVECPEYMYAFGDSYTDTGNAQAELPAFFTLHYPYGKSYRFPDRPNERTRYCNGRLVIDFTSMTLETIRTALFCLFVCLSICLFDFAPLSATLPCNIVRALISARNKSVRLIIDFTSMTLKTMRTALLVCLCVYSILHFSPQLC